VKVYAFCDVVLDAEQGLLLRGGVPVAIAPKALELLRILAEAEGRVASKRELMDALWPDTVVEEGNLAKLVHLARTAVGDADAIATVPKRGYRLAAAARRVTRAPGAPEAAPRAELAPPHDAPAVAVLPLADLTASRDKGHVCEGLSEGILMALARVPGLRVVARTSSFRLAGRDARAIGAELAVQRIVEGSVREGGSGLSIAIRVVDAQTGFHACTRTFECEFGSLARVEEETARAVADSFAIATTGASAPARIAARRDPEAVELYLLGRYLWNRRPGTVVWQALEAFERAVARDPSFAEAWAGMADAYATLGSWEAGVLPHAEAQAKARAYAELALKLSPDLAPAHTTIAYTLLHYDRDAPRADAELRRALALEPGYSAAHHWRSHALAAAGRFEESMSESLLALVNDPMNLLLNVHLAWHHHMARAPEKALAQSERVVAMDASFHWGHYFMGWAAESLGELSRAVDAHREAVRCSNDDPVMRAGLARALAVAGDRDAALALVASLGPAQGSKDGAALFSYETALVDLGLGERARALDALERAKRERSGWMVYVDVDPRLDPLRGEERFQSLR